MNTHTHNMKCSHSTICWIAIIICYSHLCSKTFSNSLWWRNIILFEICCTWNSLKWALRLSQGNDAHISNKFMWTRREREHFVSHQEIGEHQQILSVISIYLNSYMNIEMWTSSYKDSYMIKEISLRIQFKYFFSRLETEIEIIFKLNTK